MLSELEIGNEHAVAIIEYAAEIGAYDGDVPDTEKDRLEAAHEIVAFAIDAFQDEEGPNEGDEEMDQILQIFELSGVEVDGDDVTYGEPPELEEADEDDDDAEEDDDETPFDINDIIEDYDSLKVKEVVELFESGDLTAEEIVAVQEYEEDEGGGRARILKYEIPDDEEEGEDDDEEEGEDDDEEADEDEESDEESEDSGDEEDDEEDEDDEDEDDEPWEGYDDAKVAEIKEVIGDEERTSEELEYIIQYEEANKDRSTIVKRAQNRLDELGEDDEVDAEVEEDEEEEAPKKKRGRPKKAAKAVTQEDYSDDEIEDMIPAGLVRVFVKSSLDSAKKEIAERGLELPEEYEGDMPELPNDISGLSHEGLSDLLAQFQNAHATAVTAAAEKYIWANTYEEIGDYLENRILLDSDQSNDTKRKAEARTDDKVVFFRARHTENYNSYVRWRDLAKTIEGKGKVVSRVGGFIDDDNAASDLKAPKRSTRGKAEGKAKRSSK